MFWILFIYLIVAYFIPEIGVIAIICMVGPVAMAVGKGRHWCGHFCPRGSLYDRIVSRFSPHKQIPQFVRSKGFRIFMLCVIFGMFGIQLHMNGWTLAGIGRTFWNIILVTTIVGIVLGFIYAPRAWCTFCPMGTISAWVVPTKAKRGFMAVHVSESCKMKCKRCEKVCPMQLTPYEACGKKEGYLNPDCIKCGNCIQSCPTKSMEIKE